MRASAFASAKVNLYLHVGAPTADGYHPVCSLMVFADVGDRVGVEAAARPELALELVVDGPFAGELAGDPADNLVLRAARALVAAAPAPAPPFRLVLTKALPVAAGLGGGSSDAGAALRLLCETLGLKLGDAALEAVAAQIGADGPACLWGRPVVGEGRGEVLSPAPRLPTLDAVLVNPRVACPTGAVYRAYDAAGAFGGADRPLLPDTIDSVEEAAALLAACRNDLEPPAAALVPQVGEVLEVLRGESETLLARMSGSGATCFALCPGDIEAEGLAERLRALRPDWWVERCRLGGPWG